MKEDNTELTFRQHWQRKASEQDLKRGGAIDNNNSSNNDNLLLPSSSFVNSKLNAKVQKQFCDPLVRISFLVLYFS